MHRVANSNTIMNTDRSDGTLRVARIAWAVGFVLLLAVIVVRLFTVDIVQGVAEEYLVGLGLPAAAALVSPPTFYYYLMVLRYSALAIFWLVALLIFWRRSDDWVALQVSSVLLLMSFTQVLGGSDSPWQTFLTFLGLALFLLLLFVFPDGHFIPQTRQGRIMLGLTLLVAPFLSFAVISTFLPGYAPEEQAYGAFLFTLGATMVCGVISQVYRYSFVADGAQRRQTKWVLFGLSAQLVWIFWGILFILLPSDIINEATWALIGLHINVLVPLLIPVTFGVAMLRYRLWGIDPLINRALVYGALTAIIVILYIFIVGAMGVLFQARGSLLLGLLATGVVAVVFQPLREWLQKAVNKLMYGERDDPLGMLTRLARQLETADATDAILPTLVETVATALKLPYVAIWLPGKDGKTWETAATVGETQGRAEVIPLRHKNQEIGLLEVAPRSPGERLAEADRQLLVNIAQLASTTIQALQLNEQLRHSRRQLVTAREEERRRIRRDLHDGLGPVLASLTLQADTAVDLVQSDPDEAIVVLRKMRAKAQAAVADIRLLVYGLRPPALDELGLASAIRQYIASLESNVLDFIVDVPDTLPTLPAAVEVAAYRIAQEAINNVTRHARSTTCTVRLILDGELYLKIMDDGAGLPEDESMGIGLQSMSERAAELGGVCTIEALPDGGTRVFARLPLNIQKE